VLVDLEARERDLSGSLEREKKTIARDPSMALNRVLTALKRQITNLGDLDPAHATRIRDALAGVLNEARDAEAGGRVSEGHDFV
jgi:hypothetical protein